MRNIFQIQNQAFVARYRKDDILKKYSCFNHDVLRTKEKQDIWDDIRK